MYICLLFEVGVVKKANSAVRCDVQYIGLTLKLLADNFSAWNDVRQLATMNQGNSTTFFFVLRLKGSKFLVCYKVRTSR